MYLPGRNTIGQDEGDNYENRSGRRYRTHWIRLLKKLRERGHEAIAAAPNTGVNTLTGEGLAEVLKGASVVVDVSNSPDWEDSAVLKFFETSTRNLLTYEAAAGVGHDVALSLWEPTSCPKAATFRLRSLRRS